MASTKLPNTFRQYHRWLGFFLAGIMAVYATSGTLLIFRNTDFLKFEQQETRQLEPGLTASELGRTLRLRDFAISHEQDGVVHFKQGQYDRQSGLATISRKDYPAPLQQLVKLHKASTNSPLYWLNISFGLCLLFFVVSAFLMFIPKTRLYKNSLKIAGAGFIFALLVVIFAG